MSHPASVTNSNGPCPRHQHGRWTSGIAVATLLACLGAASARAQQVPQPPSTLQPMPSQPQPGFQPPAMEQQPMQPPMPMQMPQSTSKFLMPLVISALTPVLQAGLGCVFDRLFSFMGANPSPACVQPNQTSVVQPPANASQPGVAVASANPSLPIQGGDPAAPAPPAQAPGTQAQALATTPVLSFIVNKLSDATPQATVTQTVQFPNVQQAGSNLAFDIRTGESFAILFATSVPGRVRLVNTDVEKNVSASDVYEALPAADNRMPRDWQGGITMAGAKGTEYLDVNFTPCISPRYAGDPRVTMFQGQLPACTQEGDTAALALVRSRSAKAMVFPASPSAGQPIAVAPANYAKGEALTFRITIRHQ